MVGEFLATFQNSKTLACIACRLPVPKVQGPSWPGRCLNLQDNELIRNQIISCHKRETSTYPSKSPTLTVAPFLSTEVTRPKTLVSFPNSAVDWACIIETERVNFIQF